MHDKAHGDAWPTAMHDKARGDGQEGSRRCVVHVDVSQVHGEVRARQVKAWHDGENQRLMAMHGPQRCTTRLAAMHGPRRCTTRLTEMHVKAHGGACQDSQHGSWLGMIQHVETGV